MDFLEAVKAMKLGKKVRRPKWHEKNYICESAECIANMIYPAIKDLEATDWEVVDEDNDWCLRKIPFSWAGKNGFNYNEQTVKKMLDLILDDVKNWKGKNISNLNINISALKDIISKRSGLYNE